MNLSDAGMAFIKSNEGCSLAPYEDPPGSGVYSVGYGHSRWTGGDISQDTADWLLSEDLRFYVGCVNSHVNLPNNASLTQGQFDALVDFAFNEGAGAFINSTLLRKLNSGDLRGAADELLRWDKVEQGGELVVSSALAERRAAERKMFLADSPTVPDLPAA